MDATGNTPEEISHEADRRWECAGYDRVLVEPSGVYDVDEFFDVLRDEPLDRWYQIGNVITVVNAKLESGNFRTCLSICWLRRRHMRVRLC